MESGEPGQLSMGGTGAGDAERVIQTVRAVAAGVIIGLGMVLIAAGHSGLSRLWRLVIADSGYLIIATVAIILLFAVLPRGLRIAPILLLLAGLALLLHRYHTVWHGHRSELAGTAMIVGGVWLSAIRLQVRRTTVRPIVRSIRILIPRKLTFTANDSLPSVIAVTNVGTRVVVDLQSKPSATGEFVEVLVSSWAGVTEVCAPTTWPVVAGRVAAAFGVHYAGTLSDTGSIVDPQGAEGSKQVSRLLASATDPTACVVVIHVSGVGGWMTVRKA